MSAFIPSALASPTPQGSSGSSPSTSLLQTDCKACRISGTLTFSAVGIYALVQARRQAKTGLGRGAASIAGLGFLALAAARWHQAPPPSEWVQQKEREV
ncbi:hypothetical protein BCR35DRAFT_304756 [Leucosporidium creatinivorum]|uniref:Distal membrane-arm assembly complex protein 1-like domain-containing protein n=1 Tax=Leucosporidium creatinivorum TaxID=106004 RepID=A0A1Y2F669_9BASI|nr:hypothetical protein BCR35DRAFT_304756 [Leucosporidium creatinivorum]